jgi:hypothetical protein
LYHFYKKFKKKQKKPKTIFSGFFRWFFGWVFYCQPCLEGEGVRPDAGVPDEDERLDGAEDECPADDEPVSEDLADHETPEK